jgi:ABC-type uncharacterized transport system substrate-binding protein
LAAHGQEPARLAFIGTDAEDTSRIFIEALKDGLREQGLTEGRDYVLDMRWPRAGAVVIVPDQIFLDGHRVVAALALQHRLPLFSTIPEMTDAGALLSYGVVRRALYRRTAYFVKRILDGANPGDLTVEQPTRIKLAINLKTATALGMKIPDALPTVADRVIE